DSEYNDALFSILHIFIFSWEKLESYNDLIYVIDALLECLQQIPNSHLSTIERAALACLATRGREYFSTVLPSTSFTQYAIPLTLQHYIQIERIPFKKVEESSHHIDIIGLSEIQMLSFDCIIFLEACEGNLPHESKENPLLPSYIQENVFGLPHSIQEIHNEEYRFFSSLHACDTAYIMYSTTNTKQIGGKINRSRFIEKILWTKEKYSKVLLEDTLIQRDIKAQYLEPISYREGIDIDLQSAIRERLKKGISFSMLSTYIRCPFQFIQKYIAEVSLEENTNAKTNQRDLGRVVHDSLEKFFLEYKHTTIYREELLEKKEELITSILHNIDTYSALPVEQRILTHYTIPEQIELFLLHQPEYYYIEDVEKKLEARILDFPLYGTIDRIDIYNDIYYIIDYKTGGQRPRKTSLQRLINCIEEGYTYTEYLPYLRTAPLQMILYLYLLHQNYPKIEMSNAIYYFLKERDKTRITYLLSQDNYTAEFVTNIFYKIATDIIESLCELKHIECRRGTYCKYCSYQSICI
ncbi:MAG: PD-(D/E)XK nuclease family protein, partial [Desulfovibrionaceae bacterium]|nr:PD-(D/E)XK nuclease family protein [Desulfovibrionaceae bacterium]